MKLNKSRIVTTNVGKTSFVKDSEITICIRHGFIFYIEKIQEKYVDTEEIIAIE